jgi:flagellar FliJ protein
LAKFVFKLAGVLKQRQHIERQRQRDLAERHAHLSQLQQQLKQLNERVQATNDDVRNNHLTGSLNMSFLAAHRRFLAAMQRGGVEIVQRMAVAQRQVDEAQAALAEAAKQRKAIEKLREKQFERWRADEDRKEVADLDEVSMQISYHDMAQAQARAQDAEGAR